MVSISMPRHFAFRDHGLIDFDNILSGFDWNIDSGNVTLDFSKCTGKLNYQALALVVPYCWELRSRGCFINLVHSVNSERMWKLMGASGWSQVQAIPEQNFRSSDYKPLIAIRSSSDFKEALHKSETYTKGFNIEYEKTLRYVLSELLYNTMEHGRAYRNDPGDREVRIPSIVQFNWYQERDEIDFIVADLGIGIKRHISQAYSGCASDKEAILKAIQPSVSGTFKQSGGYMGKDNAGMGLYISSNIVKRLNADLYIISGNGLVHVSPKDTTSKDLRSSWPGTLVYGEVKLGKDSAFELQAIMSELRQKARAEIDAKAAAESEGTFYIHIRNYFGYYAEDKESAIRFREANIMEHVRAGETVLLDFEDVKAAPHSFLSALLATPITEFGMLAYKKIKVVNALPEIRETIDYILDDNT